MTNHDSNTQSILITGGAGFIGSHLAEHLATNNDVKILDSFVTGNRSNIPAGSTCLEGDIRDEEVIRRATEDIDLIFHEAGLVSVDQSIEQPMESHAINVDATLSLLERARDLDARIVIASSAAIYGHPDQVPITESDTKTPSSPYGLEKLTIDHYAQQYHDLYGLDTVVLRYFNVYGPGQPPNDYSGVISIFLEQALKDEPITVHGDGKQTRDFVYIDDIVQANLLAAATEHTGAAYNIGAGESVTIRELARTIIKETDSDSEIVYTEGREGDIRQSKADITAAGTRLGYDPNTSLREGIERTLDWFEIERSE